MTVFKHYILLGPCPAAILFHAQPNMIAQEDDSFVAGFETKLI